MAALKFKITEERHDVTREIEIKPNSSIKKLIQSICTYFEVDYDHSFELYNANDSWRRGIMLSNDFATTPIMTIILEPYQRFLMVTPHQNYIFCIELMLLLEEGYSDILPNCVRKENNLPHVKPTQAIILDKPKKAAPKGIDALMAALTVPAAAILNTTESEDLDDEIEDDEDASIENEDAEQHILDSEDDAIGDEAGFGTEGEREDDSSGDDEGDFEADFNTNDSFDDDF